MIEEIWKDVVGYEGLYRVSNTGKVYSLKFKRLLTPKTNQGYINIGLYKNKATFTTGLHRLIAFAFIPNPDNKPQINHKNGIRDDNRIENLEWVTSKENINHCFTVLQRKITKETRLKISNTLKGRIPKNLESIRTPENRRKVSETLKGRQHTSSLFFEAISTKVAQYNINGRFIKSFKSIKEATDQTGINGSGISLCASGRRHTSGGYIWKRT